jgi:hypothetical protein
VNGKMTMTLLLRGPYRHADAVVFAALVLAHQRVRLRIEEIRMRIERVQHPRNGPVVDRLVGIDRLRVIILDNGIDIRELLQAVFDVGVAGGRRGLLARALGKKNSQKTASQQEKKPPERVIGENYVPS